MSTGSEIDVNDVFKAEFKKKSLDKGIVRDLSKTKKSVDKPKRKKVPSAKINRTSKANVLPASSSKSIPPKKTKRVPIKALPSSTFVPNKNVSATTTSLNVTTKPNGSSTFGTPSTTTKSLAAVGNSQFQNMNESIESHQQRSEQTFNTSVHPILEESYDFLPFADMLSNESTYTYMPPQSDSSYHLLDRNQPQPTNCNCN